MAKYYQPTIDEFHFGFEYEIFEDFDVYEEKSWHKQVYGENGYNQESIDHVDGNNLHNVRVKYLDHDDIVGCGFENIGKKYFIRNTAIEKRKSDEFVFSLTFTEYEFKPPICTISYLIDGHRIKFNGAIKNISELRKIMAQIRIT